MSFTSELNPKNQKRVDACDRLLNDPNRLEALRKTNLMDSPRELAFDRLAQLAAQILRVPLTVISLVGEHKQFFKGFYGMPEPFDQTREIPIDGSICRYTLQGEAIISHDTSTDPLLMNHPATLSWKIGALIALPMVLSNGHVLGAFCAIAPLKHNWTDEEIHVLQELTASVMTEIDLRNHLRALEAERMLRERFVSTLSHDLRTPLTTAKMSAQMILRENQLSAFSLKNTQRVISSLDRANDMIKDLLDANLIQAGSRLDLAFEELDLTALVSTTLEDLKSTFGERFDFQSPSPLLGFWNSSALRRILENLCSNAIKYGSKSELIQIKLWRSEDRVILSVHNQGPFIPQEERAQLFEQFQRGNSARSGDERGWGLGLTLVKGLTEAHQGKVGIESELNSGTTFKITLPLDSRKSPDLLKKIPSLTVQV